MEKIRILFVEHNVDGTVGGSYFSLYYLVDGLDKNRYEPLVIFYTNNDLISKFRASGIEVRILEKIKPIEFKNPFNISTIYGKVFEVFRSISQKAVNLFKTLIIPGFYFAKFIKKNKIDIIHLNNSILYNQEWILAAKLLGKKCVTHERGINTYFPLLTRFWSNYIDGIICISDAVKQNLIKHGFNNSILIRIYNGIDSERFTATKTKKQMMNELHLNGNHPIIGMVGNIKEWKGQETVIRSMQYVKQKYPKIKSLLIGGHSAVDQKYIKRLHAIIDELNLSDQVIFTGKRKDVPDLMNILQVLIHASISPEPFGRVIIEGMAMQKPVIATNIGAAPEIIAEGVTGLLFPPKNERRLAEGILYLIGNSQNAQKMGKAGSLRVRDHFHISDNIKLTQTLYEKILVGHQSVSKTSKSLNN